MENNRKIGLGWSLIPIIALVFFIFAYVIDLSSIMPIVGDWPILGWGMGDAHIPLVFATVVASAIAIFKGFKWVELEKMMFKGIGTVMQAIIILMVIGMVIGSWLSSGIIATMVYYGLNILNPTIFLFATVLICSIVSLSVGSSWTTASTVGIALMAIGAGLGVDAPIVAGAVVSGAYFGDKLSPLSDTTNLAPAISGTTLFSHIKAMLVTTIPAYVVTLIVFLIIGFVSVKGSVDTAYIKEIQEVIKANFSISILLLLIPVITITAAALRLPAIPVLFGGAMLGLIATISQGVAIPEALEMLYYGFYPVVEYGTSAADLVQELFSGGGIDAMMWTIALIVIALCFGGIMEGTGMLDTIIGSLLHFVKSAKGIVVSTILTAIGINILAGEQYMSIAITGKMYKTRYIRDFELHPKNLSKALEDSGTITSALVPWNTCGAFMASALGVSTFAYLPYAVFNYLVPILAITFAFLGIGLVKLTPKQKEILLSSDEAVID